jgi:hypothetical protein
LQKNSVLCSSGSSLSMVIALLSVLFSDCDERVWNIGWLVIEKRVLIVQVKLSILAFCAAFWR